MQKRKLGKSMGMSFGYGPARDSRIRASFDKRRTAAERSPKDRQVVFPGGQCSEANHWEDA